MKNVLYIFIVLLTITCKNNNHETKETNYINEPKQEIQTQEDIDLLTECSICGNQFEGSGYNEVSEGVWEECKHPYQCQVCSPECGLKHTNRMEEFTEQAEDSNANCTFETDSDVLQFLVGKSFNQKGGDLQIRFSTDGATVSGRLYQWLSYKTMGGFKGVIKLASTSMDNPDGVLTLYVSCRENAVTDGTIVLLN